MPIYRWIVCRFDRQHSVDSGSVAPYQSPEVRFAGIDTSAAPSKDAHSLCEVRSQLYSQLYSQLCKVKQAQ